MIGEVLFAANIMRSRTLPKTLCSCRALAGTMRNLDDEQIRAIARNGGVIGLNSVNLFIRDNEPTVTISHFIDHVDHIAAIAGI